MISPNNDSRISPNNDSRISPNLGLKCKAKILKLAFSNVILSILEIEGVKCNTEYKGVLKYDKGLKLGDIVECMIVSYSDNGINLIPV